MNRNDPRMIALDALMACLVDGKPLDETLERDRRLAGVEKRDRALVHAITAEVCRRRGQIDALIKGCLQKPLPAKAMLPRMILRMGVAQLMFMDLAPHAAVSTAVDLARVRVGAFANLVNAVLRRIQREGEAWMAEQDAAQLNAPRWLMDSWTAAYGPETAHAIAAAHLERAPLDLSVASDAAGWADKLDARLLPTGGLRRAQSGQVEDMPGYGGGGWWVQDVAASLPVRLLGDVRGQHIVDLCAAPGGKTAQLAAAGARVTAVDLSEKRLERLKQNMWRQKFEVETVVGDAVSWQPETPPDAVLLDSPCSGTGTIRRHPDIAWTKTQEDVTRLAYLQGRMIEHALSIVKPGGIVVCAVCSLQPEEGAEQFRALMARRTDITHLPVAPEEISGLAEAIDGDGNLRTLPSLWPELAGMDGFHAMRLRRSGEAGT
mgnify:CR=1 FL=1|jgi:16S rRNA (cytosine967-C5)-methyltransferase